MHEGHFTEQVVEAILKELEPHKGSRIKKVSVSVGEMMHLVPESVMQHYELLTQGTRLQGVALELKEVPVMIQCRSCGQTGPVEDHHVLMCGHCDSRDVHILSGNKVVIESLQLEAGS